MSELININEADAATLTEISGIGAALAARIVEYRETVHAFEEVIELTAVPGISERMVREFEDRVTVEPVLNKPETRVEAAVEVVSEGAETAVSLPTEPAETEEDDSIVDSTDLVETEETESIITPTDAAEPEEPELVAEIMTEIEPDEDEDDETLESEPIVERTQIPSPILNREESEPIMTTESIESELPGTPPPASDTVSRRRGCLFIIIGAVAGAILGTALTLAILAAMNNGLQYASSSRLENQLENVTNSLDALNQELENANQNLEAVSTRAGTLADDQSEMSEAITGVESTLGNAQEGLATAEKDIVNLMETAVILDERIDTISESAETFDTFLTGMRDLLVDLQGMPVPTRTPFATITPGADDGTATVESDKGETAVPTTPSPTRVPTRTPRPTSTPISLPTSTPAQQP